MPSCRCGNRTIKIAKASAKKPPSKKISPKKPGNVKTDVGKASAASKAATRKARAAALANAKPCHCN